MYYMRDCVDELCSVFIEHTGVGRLVGIRGSDAESVMLKILVFV